MMTLNQKLPQKNPLQRSMDLPCIFPHQGTTMKYPRIDEDVDAVATRNFLFY